DPPLIEAFEPVAELALLRREEEGRGVVELEPARAGADLERLADVDRPSFDEHRLEDDRRGRRGAEPRRVDGDDALDRREPEAAVGRPRGRGVSAVALLARHSVRLAERDRA